MLNQQTKLSQPLQSIPVALPGIYQWSFIRPKASMSTTVIRNLQCHFAKHTGVKIALQSQRNLLAAPAMLEKTIIYSG